MTDPPSGAAGSVPNVAAGSLRWRPPAFRSSSAQASASPSVEARSFGVRKACQGRPVSEDDLALLAQEVEEQIRASGAAEIDAHEVGLVILGPLQKLDKVAYLRFASVYQAFESLEDFETAISLLRHESEQEAKIAVTETAKGAPSSEKSSL